MPFNDWTRVVAGTFHDFHYSWVAELRNALNRGLLPSAYYAQAEQVSGGSVPDVLTLHSADDESELDIAQLKDGSTVAVAQHPPNVSVTEQAEEKLYARKRDRIAVRHRSSDRTIALIDVISPGNKQSSHELKRLLEKIDSALEMGVHVLILDLHPPGPHDPRGIHAAYWEFAVGPETAIVDPPRGTLVSYRADPVTAATAYVQPISLSESLPDMPLFLDPGWYVNVPLEETYRRAYAEFPERWKRVVEGGQ